MKLPQEEKFYRTCAASSALPASQANMQHDRTGTMALGLHEMVASIRAAALHLAEAHQIPNDDGICGGDNQNFVRDLKNRLQGPQPHRTARSLPQVGRAR